MTMSISALNNLKIEYGEDLWQLSLKGIGILVKVTRDGVMFSPDFAMRRRMPQQLANGLISRIVLGWSDTDLSWHLGFLISQDVADWRGSRWCSLARWSELETPEAREASEALAATLGRNLRVVPPRNITFGATADTVVHTPPIEQDPTVEALTQVHIDPELKELPLDLGEWRFETYHGGYQFVRVGRWYLSQWGNFLWYAFWAVVFLILSIRSLTVELALPNSGAIFPRPELLPYIGIAAGLLIALLALNSLRVALTTPNRIVIDSAQRSIRVLRDNVEKWRLKSVDIDSMYVSQVVHAGNKKSSVEYAEVNVLTTRGDFKQLLMLEDELELEKPEKVNDVDGVMALSDAVTPLQVSTYYTAQALKVPVWYDQRT